MESAQIKDVVQLLIENGHLITNWTTFKDFLGLDGDAHFVILENQYKQGTITAYALFSEILSRWKSAKGQEATIATLSDILERLNFKSTAEKLQTFNGTCGSNSYHFFEIDDAIWNFVGRSTEMEKLTTWFRGQNRFITKVIGMGGMGKSELVKKFANAVKDETNGIWFNGETKESLTNSIVQVAAKLSAPTTNHDQPRHNVDIITDIIAAIRKKNKLKILLIIDNVDAENEEVHPLLKKVVKLRAFAIITSRNSSVVADAGETVNLDILEAGNAKQFVRDSIKEETEEDITKLCVTLNNFPLALQQAVAYVNVQKSLGHSFQIKEYLRSYEFNTVQVLAHPLNPIEHEYGQTTLVVWNISIEQIRQKGQIGTLAIEVLNNIGYFNADGISLEFIKALHEAGINAEDELDDELYMEAISLLKSYSLIKYENKLSSIHRLVQEVTRVNCRSTNVEEKILRKLVQSINESLIKLPQCDTTHVLSVWEHVFKYDGVVRDFSDFPFNIIITLDNLSLYRDMMEFSNRSYLILNKILGDKHLETLKVDSKVAHALSRNGKYQEALQKFTVVHKKQSFILGKDHRATLYTGHDMAWVLLLLHRKDEALKLYRSVLESRKKVLGERHRDTIETKGDMATVLSSQGEHSEAMKLHEEVLEWRKTELGEEHQFTLNTRLNIGLCLFQQKEFTMARGRFEEVLELKLKVLGEEHSSTLTTKYLLAFTLDSLGESEKGLEMMKEVLVSREKLLGSEHPTTIGTRGDIDIISRRTIPAPTTECESHVHVSDTKKRGGRCAVS